MTRRKGLVLDANILLRAVFGVRVRALWETYEEEVSFYSPYVCFDDARKYIPEIAKRRRIDPALGLSVLDQARVEEQFPACAAVVHSSRSSVIGSIDSARCAGIHVATSPSNNIARTAPPNTSGSWGVA